MKNFCYYLFILFSFLSFGQSQENEKANFDLASKFSPTNIAINIKQLMDLNII